MEKRVFASQVCEAADLGEVVIVVPGKVKVPSYFVGFSQHIVILFFYAGRTRRRTNTVSS